jgi:hypothetical protein
MYFGSTNLRAAANSRCQIIGLGNNHTNRPLNEEKDFEKATLNNATIEPMCAELEATSKDCKKKIRQRKILLDFAWHSQIDFD